MKIFYLRNEKGFPVTCVASKLVKKIGGEALIYFDFATHNPVDRYKKSKAVEIATERLEKHNRFAVVLQSQEGETRRRIVEHIADVADSQAAKEAARLWLQKPIGKVFSEEATAALTAALPIINELFGLPALEQELELRGYQADWKEIWRINAAALAKKFL